MPFGDIVYGVGIFVGAVVDVVTYFGVDNVAAVADGVMHSDQAAQQVKDFIDNTTSNDTSPGDPKDPRNWNKNSTRVNSKTLYEKKGIRVDVENPNPAQRPGQVHIQTGDGKFIYDNVTQKFYSADTHELASKAIQDLMNDPNISKAVYKGVEKYLGLTIQ